MKQTHNKTPFWKNPYLQFIVLGIVLAMLPTLAKLGVVRVSAVTIIGTMLIYTIVSLGLNILLGYSGLISLGTAGFMGLAAYFAAYFTHVLKLPFELSFLISVLVPTILGTIVGVLSLRFAGIYLGIATLAVGEILREIFVQFDAFTNGASGAAANYPVLLGKFKLDRMGTYLLIVAITILIFILAHNMLHGKFGRALNAMRGSEAAAQAMGVNIYKHRLIAFATATFLASVAGVLYVHYIRISYPTTWGLPLSLDFLAIVVVGGFRSIYGTLIGSFVIFGMTDLVLKNIPFFEKISPVIKGVLMIIFIIYYPNGLAHIATDVKSFFARRKKAIRKRYGKQERGENGTN